MQNFYEFGCVVGGMCVILAYIYSTIINFGKKYLNMKRAGLYYDFSLSCIINTPYGAYTSYKQTVGHEVVFFFVFVLLGMGLSWITVIYYIYCIIKYVNLPKRIKHCRKELCSKTLDKYTVWSLLVEINGYFGVSEFEFTLDEHKKGIDIFYDKNFNIKNIISTRAIISTTRNKICLWINHVGGYTTEIYLYKEEGDSIFIKLVEYCQTLFPEKGKLNIKYFVRGGKVDENLIKQENYEIDYFNKERDLHKLENKMIEMYIHNNRK